MNTQEMMKVALNLAKLEEIPVDSGIYCEGENIKKVLMGIDMGTPELLLARELKYDCVVSHHGSQDDKFINVDIILDTQIETMVKHGVPINKAQKALSKIKKTMKLNFHGINSDRASSVARLINMPYFNMHQIADLLTERFVQNYIDDKVKNKTNVTLKDIIKILNEIYEYQNGYVKPFIAVGKEDSFAGKNVVTMAGGTDGGIDVSKAYFEAGVGTLICMHMDEKELDQIESHNVGNVIIAGHMPSDSIGMNIIAKEWEKAGIKVTKISGMV
ncbi:hypothetical protein PV797_12995 [Clostridiaceae bacterium M8S5]|nr:hypothetical protein PV797_12995 [Clostridiaceae bacterium M8S5]